MGMYDEIICDYPLPGTPPAFVNQGHVFQTKDWECDMSRYRIATDGTVDILDFTGTLDFYTTNVCGSAWGVTFTGDGADAESVEYRATFRESKVVSLVENCRDRQSALPIAEMHKRSASNRQRKSEG
jgi:hypothetical protein